MPAFHTLEKPSSLARVMQAGTHNHGIEKLANDIKALLRDVPSLVEMNTQPTLNAAWHRQW